MLISEVFTEFWYPNHLNSDSFILVVVVVIIILLVVVVIAGEEVIVESDISDGVGRRRPEEEGNLNLYSSWPFHNAHVFINIFES